MGDAVLASCGFYPFFADDRLVFGAEVLVDGLSPLQFQTEGFGFGWSLCDGLERCFFGKEKLGGDGFPF